MARIPGIRMKRMKNYHPMEYMRAIRYLKQPQRITLTSGRLDTFLKIRSGGLQILAKTLLKVISPMSFLRYLSTAAGFSIFRDFAITVRIRVVWLPVRGRLYTREKKMVLSSLIRRDAGVTENA